MEKATCIHIITTTSFSFYHNDRSKKPSYATGDSCDNEFDLTAQEATAKALELYTMAQINYIARTKQKLQAKNTLAEAVIVIDDRHTLTDIHAVAKMVEEKTGYTAIQSSIHRDEQKNLHAHIVFFTLDENGKSLQRKNFNNKTLMKELQTQTANILGMARGQSKEITKAEHLSHKQYKASLAVAQKHKTQELQKWHNRLKDKVVNILQSTSDAIKRFFLSNEFEKVEAENNQLKQDIRQSTQVIKQSKAQVELLANEANLYKLKLAEEKAKHIEKIILPAMEPTIQLPKTVRQRTL